MVKKLYELISDSPAPWSVPCLDLIVDANNRKVADFAHAYFKPSDAVMCLFAAAPEMYECLREIVERHYCCESCSHRLMGYFCNGCKGKEYREILAKAAGEEVANG